VLTGTGGVLGESRAHWQGCAHAALTNTTCNSHGKRGVRAQVTRQVPVHDLTVRLQRR